MGKKVTEQLNCFVWLLTEGVDISGTFSTMGRDIDDVTSKEPFRNRSKQIISYLDSLST